MLETHNTHQLVQTIKPKYKPSKNKRQLDYACGRCGQYVGYLTTLFHRTKDMYNYCRKCGTKQDWSEVLAREQED